VSDILQQLSGQLRMLTHNQLSHLYQRCTEDCRYIIVATSCSLYLRSQQLLQRIWGNSLHFASLWDVSILWHTAKALVLISLGFGGAPMVLGGGTIADLISREQRGTAMVSRTFPLRLNGMLIPADRLCG
jgi:hypothetical protein